MRKKICENYLYFSLFFITLSVVQIFHLAVIKETSFQSIFFFLVYGFSQSFLEAITLMCLMSLIRNYLPKFCFFIFLQATFCLLFLRVLDFPLVRLMDISIWYWLDFILGESSQNFIEMLRSSGVSIFTWILSAVCILVFFGFTTLFFYLTQKLSFKKPVLFSYSQVIKAWCVLPICIGLFDYIGRPELSQFAFEEHQKGLPWKKVFFTPESLSIELVDNLKDPLTEKEARLEIDKFRVLEQEKPDVFLLVIESLREDFITPQIAPHLSDFRKANICCDLNLSSSNATQTSWFSLFHSQLPFYFSKMNLPDSSSGSIPLKIFKKLGYEVHVYSSSGLTYYDMDKCIFGKNRELADSLHLFGDEKELAYHSDRKMVDQLLTTLSSKKSGGRLFVLFFESTHFNYSWPKEESLFLPFSKKIDYLKILYSKKDREAVKNRYRNAIHYVDKLFGGLSNYLKEHSLWDQSHIVVLSDHGEEFYEQGCLFHISHLSKEQTEVPIYYKLGNNQLLNERKLATYSSHLDVFPTLLHSILKEEIKDGLLQGRSIFTKNPFPFVFVTRYNASRSPYEFLIHNGKNKLIVRFNREKNIFESDKLNFLWLKDKEDQMLEKDLDVIQQEFGEAIKVLFKN